MKISCRSNLFGSVIMSERNVYVSLPVSLAESGRSETSRGNGSEKSGVFNPNDYLTNAMSLVEGGEATVGEFQEGVSKDPLAVVDALLNQKGTGDMGEIEAAAGSLPALDSASKMKIAQMIQNAKWREPNDIPLKFNKSIDKGDWVRAAAILLKIHNAVGSEYYEKDTNQLSFDALTMSHSRTLDNIGIVQAAVAGISKLSTAGVNLHIGPNKNTLTLNALADPRVIDEIMNNGGDYLKALSKYKQNLF